MPRHEIIVPELGLDEVVLSLWLVELGAPVTEGDRVAELLAEGVTVDLPAPATGILIDTQVEEDDPIAAGQILGIIESPAGDPTAADDHS
jgi:2-oxoglutarate dehydrogenase E2 component (dihydrolipoamide succinyltransferase)